MYPPLHIKTNAPPIFAADLFDLMTFMKIPSKEKVIESAIIGADQTLS
jgi:hypothetical protein